MSSPAPLPDPLETPLEKLVFLFVREHGHASVYDLRDALDVPQLRLYPTIDRLGRYGLVDRQGDNLWLADPDQAPEPIGARA